jgi:hypothetical protein
MSALADSSCNLPLLDRGAAAKLMQLLHLVNNEPEERLEPLVQHLRQAGA